MEASTADPTADWKMRLKKDSTIQYHLADQHQTKELDLFERKQNCQIIALIKIEQSDTILIYEKAGSKTVTYSPRMGLLVLLEQG